VSVTKTFTFKGVQTIHRSTFWTMNSLKYHCKYLFETLCTAELQRTCKSPAVIAIPAYEPLCPTLYRYFASNTPPYDHPWRLSDLLLPSVPFGRSRLLRVAYSFPYFLFSRPAAGKRSGLTILRSCFGWETIVNGCGRGGGWGRYFSMTYFWP
jgi:hypothetical protein